LETKKKVLIIFCIVVIIAGVLLMVKHGREKQDVPPTGAVTEQGQEDNQEDGPSVVEQQQDDAENGEGGATSENDKEDEVFKGDVVGRTFSGSDTLVEFLDKKRMVITVQAGNGIIETLYQYDLGGDRIKMSKDGMDYTYSFERTKNGIRLDGISYKLVGGGDEQ